MNTCNFYRCGLKYTTELKLFIHMISTIVDIGIGNYYLKRRPKAGILIKDLSLSLVDVWVLLKCFKKFFYI